MLLPYIELVFLICFGFSNHVIEETFIQEQALKYYSALKKLQTQVHAQITANSNTSQTSFIM